MRRARAPRALPLALALALAALLHTAAGAGVFELQILELSNYRARLASGACCAGGARADACGAPCRTRFALCLKEYQSAAAPGACSFGRAASPALGADSFTLAEPLYTLALPFTFRWTRSFTMILQAYDDYNYTDSEETGLIEEAWWSGIVEPGGEWHLLRHAGAAAALAYRVRVTCQPNYYNSTCTTFCRARDDQFGHFACSPHGDKRCLPGWQGDNCEIPVCKEGCHATHGRCDHPGECICRPGWRGELCAQCQPYPGCKRGYCNGSSWDCTCDTNWGGILCDQDLNYCGTHEPCRHGGTCENTAPDQYLCTCAEGFSGTDCERVDNPCAPAPCAHGACALHAAPPGFACACERGWGGALCDRDLDDCASAPCRNGATCRDRLDAFDCACAPGWAGPLCADDVDECAALAEGPEGALGPCVNAATCNNTLGGYACTCLAGWTGRDCELNVDDCAGQCLHGATCIDLVDDYHCACAPGYAGRTCARDVDDCASHPCRHGGECVDLLDAYRCICPVGFAGRDCELSSCSGRYCRDDRDHCASAPCDNGAACYTAQDDFYCHCAPGWAGKTCAQRARAEREEDCLTSGCDAGGTCVPAPAPGEGAARCACRAGRAGARCQHEENECDSAPCHNNATCVDGPADFACVCPAGWSGKTCALRDEPAPAGDLGLCAGVECLHGGTCVARVAAPGWACACREGRAGARCERERAAAAAGCASAPCRHGARCVGGAGWWACECPAGWAGADCARPAPAPAPACAPACPPPARCAAEPPRCVCPATPPRLAARCLELLAGLGAGDEEARRDEAEAEPRADEDSAPGECGARNGTWWWGCNACACAGAGGAVCTRLWCGLPDCLAPHAPPCRTDEVCVPAAPRLCLRAPCAPLGECRRVAGRRVEPPALPAPPACWPGAAAAQAPPGCARAQLQLARERLARGAHVERACQALRRALAAALATQPAPAPLALLCDLADEDEDTLDLALWVGEEEGAADALLLGAAVRALSELVARRRLGAHAVLRAALRLRVPHAPRAAPAAPAARAAPAPALALALGGAALLLLAGGAGAALALRRRRARAARAAEHSRRRDEEKSNNLQNEENLRRYANPLRAPAPAALAPAAPPAPRPPDELPRAHSLYKAQNADARNNTPAPARDKELTKRAPPPARAPPERLTVLV